DGDLDLYVTQHSGPSNEFSRPATQPVAVALISGNNTMWRNNGNGTFTDVTKELGLARPGLPGLTAIGSDYDNDRAVDLIVPGPGALPAVNPGASCSLATFYHNPREGQFFESGIAIGNKSDLGQAVGMAVLDFDHDGWLDLVFTHYGSTESPVTLWRNNRGKSF